MSKIKIVSVGNPYRTPHEICIVAQSKMGEVGKLFASIGSGGKIRVDRLGVDPAFRRQGIAKAMFEKMLEEAKTYFSDMKLHVCYVYPVPSGEMYSAVSLPELETFYSALGFKEADEGMWVKDV